MLKNIPHSVISSVSAVLKESSAKIEEQNKKDRERAEEVRVKSEAIMEKLVGNQHKIDKNKNKRIDKQDFEMLRKEKSSSMQEAKGLHKMTDAELTQAHDDLMAKIDASGKPAFNDKRAGRLRQIRFHKLIRQINPELGYKHVKEEVSRVEQIEEAKRLISKHGEGVHTAKVYKDTEYNEYQVHFFKHGKHMGEGPVSYHDEKEDAQKTADHAVKQMNSRTNEEKDTPGNGYSHQCAVHVKHSKLGEGKTLFSQHADPDSEGNIAWYDVMFDEGIKRVETKDLEILVSESHKSHKKM